MKSYSCHSWIEIGHVAASKCNTTFGTTFRFAFYFGHFAHLFRVFCTKRSYTVYQEDGRSLAYAVWRHLRGLAGPYGLSCGRILIPHHLCFYSQIY